VSILDKLKLSRRAKRAEAQAKIRLATHAPEHGQLDRWQLDDLMRDSPKFRDRVTRPIELGDGKGVYEPSVDIHQDLFLGAHATGETRVRPTDEMRPSHQFGRDVIHELFKTEAFKDTKPFMEADELASALYTMGAADKLDELLNDKSVQDALEQSQQAQSNEQALDECIADLEAAREQVKQQKDDHGYIPDGSGWVQQVKDLTAQREQLVDAINGTPVPAPVPVEVKAKIEEAAKEGQTRVEVWGAIAGSGIGDLEHATPDEALALTEAWMQIPDFMELCKLLGRVQRDFRAQQARNVIGGSEQIVGVELGNNLTSTLPSELARLGNPLTQRSFMRDYMDEQLLQFATEGDEKVDMGPGVLLIDVSGSMGTGSRLVQAKAVAIAFIKLMHRKQRDAIVVCFNSRVVYEHHFAKRGGTQDAQHLLQLAGLRESGGTNITNAALRAEKLIGKPTFKRADILVVTDGHDNFTEASQALRDRFEAAGVRRHGVAIDHEPQQNGFLLRFCDDAISVDDLTKATGDIVRAVS
jgi:uncharacterized protein with von Willebrand factor type A (vWA) domain